MTITRRNALAIGLAASATTLTGAAPAFAANGDVFAMNQLMNNKGPADRPLGADDAPVTVIEYASPTCPHCAAFHINTYPAFKEQYVDTGKVKFILRPYARNVLDAVVFMLAETADDDGYHQIVKTYFETQSQWSLSEKPRDELLNIALQLGFTEESFEAALTNQDLFNAIDAARKQASEEFDLTGTPTFYINGKQFSGDMSLDDLAAEIDPQIG